MFALKPFRLVKKGEKTMSSEENLKRFKDCDEAAYLAFSKMGDEERAEVFHYLLDQEEYGAVTDLVETLGEEADEMLLGLSAVAHNNLEHYDLAIEVLERIAEDLRDAKWYYRYGYACTFLSIEGSDAKKRTKDRQRALDSFERAMELAEDSEVKEWCAELAWDYLRSSGAFTEEHPLLKASVEEYAENDTPQKFRGKEVYRKIDVEEVKAIEDIWDINDPMYWTIDIYGSYENYLESAKPFSLEQRYVYAVMWYFMEVNNGGHHQFFFNSTGIVWKDALDGLRLFGATDVADNFQRVIDYFGGEISFDRAERIDLLNRLEEKEGFFDFLDEADDVVFDYGGAHMEDYARTHPEKFVFEGTYIDRM